MKESDLTVLCEKLEKCPNSLCEKNEIVCVKKVLLEYIDNDKNKLLRLKAQISMYDKNKNSVHDFISKFLSVITFCGVVIYNVSSAVLKNVIEGSNYIWPYVIYTFSGMSIIAITYIAYGIKTPKNLKKEEWIRYIEVVLNDIEKDFDKGSKIEKIMTMKSETEQ